MKLHNEFEQGSEAWLNWRKGKITSTGAKTLVGYKDMLKAELLEVAKNFEFDDAVLNKMKVDELKELIFANEPDFDTRVMVYKSNEDFEFRMLAYELSDGTAPEEDARDRGHRLEPEARELFALQTGKKVDVIGGLSREDEPRICMSPDGIIFNGDVIDESTEIKCLAGWKHVKVWQKNEILADHREQCVDYFVVNDDLKKLYYISYCPEIKKHPLHVIEITREELAKDIAMMLHGQKQFLKEHDDRLAKIYFG